MSVFFISVLVLVYQVKLKENQKSCIGSYLKKNKLTFLVLFSFFNILYFILFQLYVSFISSHKVFSSLVLVLVSYNNPAQKH